MCFERFNNNPIITREDLQVSRDGFEIFGVFNCGAVKVGGEYLLLLRVAERPTPERDWLNIPLLNETCDDLKTRRIRANAPGIDATDNRVVRLANGRILLTSISHFRLARSKDGRTFSVDEKPAMFPSTEYERYGIEDPRITYLDGQYWISYSAISPQGVATAFASTTDWRSFKRHGIVFAPTDKDVCLFPEKIDGHYVCRHRPWAEGIGAPAIWTAYSSDLQNWGGHSFTMGPRENHWDEERVGCGAPPIHTDEGWLEIYHGANIAGRYCLGAMLSEITQPARVIGQSENPVLEPTAEYETHGVYSPCVFSSGVIEEKDGTLLLYYGAADTVTAGASATIDDLLNTIERNGF
ncbi:MAG: glycoside hydrolase family 130 protein [Planctomycetes bacterium]|nr:glycoside hydrolase family 130 protein [Planctomycetota bacterium]